MIILAKAINMLLLNSSKTNQTSNQNISCFFRQRCSAHDRFLSLKSNEKRTQCEFFTVLLKIARYIEKTVILLLKMIISSSSAAIKFTENTFFAGEGGGVLVKRLTVKRCQSRLVNLGYTDDTLAN